MQLMREGLQVFGGGRVAEHGGVFVPNEIFVTTVIDPFREELRDETRWE